MTKGEIIAVAHVLRTVIDCGIDEDEHWRRSSDIYVDELEVSDGQRNQIPTHLEWQEVFEYLLEDPSFVEMLETMIQPLREYRQNV